MRIIHFADLHIGVEQYGRFDPRTGYSTRLQDFLGALDELVDYSIDTNADLVLFAGDAYKTREPTQTQQREFAKRIVRLVRAGVPVFLLVGNHDLPKAAWRANALEIFQTLEIDLVTVADQFGRYDVKTKAGPLQIVAVPWPNVSGFLASEDQRSLSIEQINQQVSEGIAEAIANCSETLDPAVPAVLTAHISMPPDRIREASERWMTVGWHPLLLRSNLSAERFDYVALGHHHAHQIIGQHPYVIYPGSMQRVDFGEEDDDKGFVVLTIDPSAPAGQRVVGEPEFHKVHARRFLTICLRPKLDDPTAEVLTVVDQHDVKDAVVRLVLELSPLQDQMLQESVIRRSLSDAHVLAGITRNVEQAARRRLPQSQRPEILAPMDALRVYLDEQQTPPDRKEVLLGHAQKLVEELNPEPESA
jgi:DNA repair protein SbcD/Mre11